MNGGLKMKFGKEVTLIASSKLLKYNFLNSDSSDGNCRQSIKKKFQLYEEGINKVCTYTHLF